MMLVDGILLVHIDLKELVMASALEVFEAVFGQSARGKE